MGSERARAVKPFVYGSVCSGIEAASAAWHSLGWRSAFYSEIEAFPSAVLKHHYPGVENRGDMTRFKEWPHDSIDLLVGGTPCQSFSVAGLRKGMADPRGNLALVFLALADRLRPRWVVWENVPGVLSQNEGRDFASIVGGLGKLGYGWSYRVLDAQYFGVPQRRRRVFLVGHLGDWRRAAAVLLERKGLSWDPPPSREASQGTAPCLEARTRSGRGPGTDAACDGALVDVPDSAHALNAHGGPHGRLDAMNETFIPVVAGTLNNNGKAAGSANQRDVESGMLVTHALTGVGHDASEDGTGRGTPVIPIAFSAKDHGDDAGELAPTLRGMSNADSHANGGGQIAVQRGMAVRRLTPRECERLQGFPDDYTLITFRKKPAADGPRYMALGNSMAVPVMRWIGGRVKLVDELAAVPR